jgi:O-antigen ligase
VANGVRIAAAHPLVGVGVGGFKRAYAERVQRFKTNDPKLAASHTTPVTVAAEGGVVGLALYLALLGALLLQAFRLADRSLPGTVALAAGLALAAVICHSIFYADFFEDPTTWLLIGLIGLSAAHRAVPVQEELPPAAVKEQAVPV